VFLEFLQFHLFEQEFGNIPDQEHNPPPTCPA